ncbi:MAG TPA: hydantoinase/oxoprolinase family protein, partial [Xanthobacteraceae bacterium]
TIGDHTLIAFGGAAPLHAARVAEKIGVSRVIVPPNAGVGSAVGFLAAPVSYEIVRSRPMRLDAFDGATVSDLLAAMEDEARGFVAAGAQGAPLQVRRLAFMRYVGQGHEITVPVARGDLQAAGVGGLRVAFETEYAALFKRIIPGAGIEALSWSVLVSTAPPPPPRTPAVQRQPAPPPIGTRSIFDARLGSRIDVPLYRRDQMAAGAQVSGPAVIVEEETSTVIPASFDAAIDGARCIVMQRRTNERSQA